MAKLTKKDAREIARFRAGLILQSALNAGWWPDDLVDRYGDDGVQEIADQLQDIAKRLHGEDQ